ncbi:MAG: 2'-5' RNA ligase family protein [Prosthecobacter sp.]
MPEPELPNGFYLATLPPEDLHGELASRAHITQGRNGFFGVPRPTLRFHATLANVNRLGRGLKSIEQKVNLAMPKVVEAIRPFNLVFDRLKSFANNNACVLATNASDHEFRALCRQINRGLRVPVSNTPHVTLLYDSKMISDDLLEEPIVWPVSEIFLVEAVNNEDDFRRHANFSLGAS